MVRPSSASTSTSSVVNSSTKDLIRNDTTSKRTHISTRNGAREGGRQDIRSSREKSSGRGQHEKKYGTNSAKIRFFHRRHLSVVCRFVDDRKDASAHQNRDSHNHAIAHADNIISASVQRSVKQMIRRFLERRQRHHRFLHLLDSEPRHSQHLPFKPAIYLPLPLFLRHTVSQQHLMTNVDRQSVRSISTSQTPINLTCSTPPESARCAPPRFPARC